MGAPAAFADPSDRRDTIAGQRRASGSDPYAPARSWDGLHRFNRLCGRSVAPWCRSSMITRIRLLALADSHAPGRPAATSVLAAYDRLKPANPSIRSAYHSETAAYPRHPACPSDASLAQLNAHTCGGFDAGGFSAPHPSDDAEKLTCDIRSSTSSARCPALAAPTRDQGRNTMRRFPPGDGSALRDPGSSAWTGAIDRH